MHGRALLSTRRFLVPAACGLAISVALPASADEPAPAAPPTPPPRLIVAPSVAPILEPVRPNVPPPSMTDLGLSSNPPLLREGAFVSGARAQVVKGKSGRWYAIFDPDSTGRQLPPMVLAETANLAAIERAAAREAGQRMRLAGRVTVYRDRNFLITTAPPIIERVIGSDTETERRKASEAASAAAASQPAPGSPPPADGSKPPASPSDPSVEQIIADLDKAVGTRRTVPVDTRTQMPNTDASLPSGMTAVVEPTDAGVTGGFLTSRKARVIRSPDGALIAVLDNGASGRTDAPLTLIPCQNLTAIEGYVDNAGETAMFTLTGEVFVYKSRRFLLPTMYTIIRPSENVFPAH